MDRNIPIILSDYVPKFEAKYDIGGTCCYCKKNDVLIEKSKVIGVNTKEQNIFTGSGFCQKCVSVIKQDEFRKKSFIFTKDKIIYPKYKEIYDLLFAQFDPPYLFSIIPLLALLNNIYYAEMNYSIDGYRKVVYKRENIKFHLQDDKKYHTAIDELYNKHKQIKEMIKKRVYRNVTS